MAQTKFDIVIVGGGTGGCAAALAATNLGCRVLMTEETIWIGGQFTSQAVPPDENPWIESYGATQSYQRFRQLVRKYYRDHYPLTFEASNNPLLNPGQGWVSALCHEPRVALAVFEELLAPARSAGLLEIRLRTKPVSAEVDGDFVRAVNLLDLESGTTYEVEADYFLDATELGDLLPLTGAEYVSGAESRAQTGELHAPEIADPENIQAITWCFAMGYDPGGNHVIDRPSMYDFWNDYVPSLSPVPWPGPLLSMRRTNPFSMMPDEFAVMPGGKLPSLFTYRRILSSNLFQPGTISEDVSAINWPQNDYLLTNIIDKPQNVIDRAYYEAKQLSLSLLYWLQTEAPRVDQHGAGYPELRLRNDIAGTVDGLAMAPYIRESRRIAAKFTVTEAHVGSEMLSSTGRDRAVRFLDSVGIGHYRIDLHPTATGDNYIDIESKSFQIPLGALLPQRLRNLLPACKNLGVTHITNGCYRLHPVEWNIGESTGYLAASCIKSHTEPHAVYEKPDRIQEFQQLIRSKGIPTAWPSHHTQ